MKDDASESIVVDGVEVLFVAQPDGGFRLLAYGGEIGRLETVGGGTELVAYRPDGTALTTGSIWGGPVTTRFGSRSLAARALLAAAPSR